ncbi:hypothetical protein F7725_001683 [Dissostichus mawsoni]|uniref:CARD domain-containing protein n=1 Tax=Dissostichus mawsoni TaxID=36200 RepID=A0A7J5Y0A8_DISMA|nr:hypothetical protein F7725_001683 [Dissostichus mawsoni]
MEKLESDKARLCTWLSEDPDFILNKCGNILLMKEFLEVQKRSNALEKMEITDVKSETLNVEIKTEMDPRSWTTGTAVGPVPQSDYTALNGSIICADKISGVNSDILNLSVSVKSVNTGRQDTATPSVDETLPSHQGPAAKMILSNKLRLIDCLSADTPFILQYVQQWNIISNRQYGNLKDLSQREKTVIELIDQVIRKGEEFCSLFLEVLKQPDILETYPNLNKIKW